MQGTLRGPSGSPLIEGEKPSECHRPWNGSLAALHEGHHPEVELRGRSPRVSNATQCLLGPLMSLWPDDGGPSASTSQAPHTTRQDLLFSPWPPTTVTTKAEPGFPWGGLSYTGLAPPTGPLASVPLVGASSLSPSTHPLSILRLSPFLLPSLPLTAFSTLLLQTLPLPPICSRPRLSLGETQGLELGPSAWKAGASSPKKARTLFLGEGGKHVANDSLPLRSAMTGNVRSATPWHPWQPLHSLLACFSWSLGICVLGKHAPAIGIPGYSRPIIKTKKPNHAINLKSLVPAEALCAAKMKKKKASNIKLRIMGHQCLKCKKK